jgi:preprotein translocase subunit YajC
MNMAFAILLQQASPSSIGLFLPIILMVGIMYLLMIRPQQTRQKKWQAMLEQLKAGDRIVTSGGIKGAILSIKDDAVILRVPPDNLKLEVTRGSIVTVGGFGFHEEELDLEVGIDSGHPAGVPVGYFPRHGSGNEHPGDQGKRPGRWYPAEHPPRTRPEGRNSPDPASEGE